MDLTPIVARLSAIAVSVNALREVQPLSYDEFVADRLVSAATERHFQVAIQAALDIGTIILAEQSVAVPAAYRDVFPTLAAIGVLPEDFAQRLAPMAQFRNVLVHMYLQVDPHKVYDYLQNHLGDFESFARFISEYISSASSAS